jgi:hypothetical protein
MSPRKIKRTAVAKALGITHATCRSSTTINYGGQPSWLAQRPLHQPDNPNRDHEHHSDDRYAAWNLMLRYERSAAQLGQTDTAANELQAFYAQILVMVDIIEQRAALATEFTAVAQDARTLLGAAHSIDDDPSVQEAHRLYVRTSTVVTSLLESLVTTVESAEQAVASTRQAAHAAATVYRQAVEANEALIGAITDDATSRALAACLGAPAQRVWTASIIADAAQLIEAAARLTGSPQLASTPQLSAVS